MSSLTPDDPNARDPRAKPSDWEASMDSGGDLRPAVANPRAKGDIGLIVGGVILLGLLTFAFLNAHRTAPAQSLTGAKSVSGEIAPAPPPPSDLVSAEAAGRTLTAPAIPGPQFTTNNSTPAVALVTPPPHPSFTAGLTIDQAALGRKAPALVVDLGEGPPSSPTVGAAGSAQAGPPKSGPGLAGGAGPSGLNADEQFAERVGAGEPEKSRATLLRNTQQTIPQGAMIPGVLETALNSDLPGYARAVVSRDVRGFDGSTVLVPRGSRVIGQYKSAVSQGQSRAFVIWTRIIRPDGASIQIASSGTDPLGRAGLEGTVDRHFFERFGGAVLLSVINAGVASLARAPSTQVVIGSNTDAASLGASALQPTTIAPTIKVPQGSPIRIFVARDLDFSPVGAAK